MTNKGNTNRKSAIGFAPVISIILCFITVSGCEGENITKGRAGDVSDGTDPNGTDPNGTDPDGTDPEVSTDESPPTPGCGDGILTDDEACDDGNMDNEDGCAGNCKSVAAGYSCNPPGEPCKRMARCGDNEVTFPELCDDGNMNNEDGCSDLCKVEIGFKCEGVPNVCSPTVCGDNNIEGAESCDDGNDIPFDGCSDLCQVEPTCASGGSCTSGCGDGLVLNEECDDGGNLDGDGCSSDCKQELGYLCTQPEVQGILEVPVVYKDFNSAHADFENSTTGCAEVSAGMIQNSLDANGKPVFQASLGSCGLLTSLDEWYDHSSNPDAVLISTIKLYENENGDYVNRWGENGEAWVQKKRIEWADWIGCSTAAAGCESCAAVEGYDPDNGWLCDEACSKWISGAEGPNLQYAVCAAWDGSTFIDGNPFFFPMDGHGISSNAEYAAAACGPMYSGEGYPAEPDALENAGLTVPADHSFSHNFGFTSEVRFWFQYDDNTDQLLNFVGDDDVWVFINNKLELDLGGIHEPVEGTVDVNNLGLTSGEVYEIVVFQAERQTNGSTYRLTLSGFNTSRSECRPHCGDGIIGLGEECDDADNDGGYGECGENCKLDQYCGDSIVQEEYEECDDGNFIENDGCPTSCRKIALI